MSPDSSAEGSPPPGIDPSEQDVTSYADLSRGSAPAPEASVMGEWAASVVRILVVLFAALSYVFVTGTAGTHQVVAFPVLAVAGVYSLYLFAAEPHRRFDARVSKLAVSVADLGLVIAWLYATGGAASEYEALLYASVIAMSFRYDLGRTLLGALAHVGAFFGLLYAMGDLAANLSEATVRGGFIVLLGSFGSLLSMIAARETVAKDAYRELAEELERSLSLHRATLDATRDGILVVDRDGKIVSYNSRFQEMWGIPDGIVEAREDELALACAVEQLEDPEAFMERVRELYDRPAAESLDEIVLEDGRVFERYSRPQRVGGEIVGRVWSFHDVTEERETQAELERSNEELRRFTSAVSHDVREPLRTITGYLDLLQARGEEQLDEQLAEYLAFARDGARRLEQMIQGLLRYSRVERHGEPLASLDLTEPVQDAQENLRGQIEEAGARFTIDELPTVQGDRAQLTTLFQNLFSNAIRHNDEGQPRIYVEADRGPDRHRITVRDEGPGIPPKEQEEIFEMFRQGSAPGSSEGEGIGLAMVQKIVERHGGEIEVDSTPGQGTAFTFTLEPAPGEPDR